MYASLENLNWLIFLPITFRAAKLSMWNFLSLDQPSSSHGGATERSQFDKWRHLPDYQIHGTVEPLTNDHPHQRPSLSYDHISCDGPWFLFVYESLTSDHPSYRHVHPPYSSVFSTEFNPEYGNTDLLFWLRKRSSPKYGNVHGHLNVFYGNFLLRMWRHLLEMCMLLFIMLDARPHAIYLRPRNLYWQCCWSWSRGISPDGVVFLKYATAENETQKSDFQLRVNHSRNVPECNCLETHIPRNGHTLWPSECDDYAAVCDNAAAEEEEEDYASRIL